MCDRRLDAGLGRGLGLRRRSKAGLGGRGCHRCGLGRRLGASRVHGRLAATGCRLVGTDRQLQHGGLLPRAHASHQHDLAVGELECIVMRVRAVHVYLAEARHSLTGLAKAKARQQPAEDMVGLDRLIKDELGSRQQAHRDLWLTPLGKTTGKAVDKVGRDQLVADFGRPVGYAVQAIIAHV